MKAGKYSSTKSCALEALKRSGIFRKLQRAFCEATGISLELADPECGTATATRRPAKDFCGPMTMRLATRSACQQCRKNLARSLGQKLRAQEAQCFAGLSELAVPIMVGGCHIATLVGGRVFQQKPSRRQFERLVEQLKGLGISGHWPSLRSAYFRMPVVATRRFKGAMRLLDILAQQLAEAAPRLALADMPGDPPSVRRAKQLIRTHGDELLSLSRIAGHAGLSPNHLCRTFRHATGMTLTEFIAQVRVERARDLLADGALRMNDVAEAAGFQSISQFNRTFRRLEGSSPTCFRSNLHPC